MLNHHFVVMTLVHEDTRKKSGVHSGQDVDWVDKRWDVFIHFVTLRIELYNIQQEMSSCLFPVQCPVGQTFLGQITWTFLISWNKPELSLTLAPSPEVVVHLPWKKTVNMTWMTIETRDRDRCTCIPSWQDVGSWSWDWDRARSRGSRLLPDSSSQPTALDVGLEVAKLEQDHAYLLGGPLHEELIELPVEEEEGTGEA